jgi:hypothetical protein
VAARIGIGRQLIDTMAQAQTAQLYWLDIFTLRCASNSIKRDEGRWAAVTVEDAEAMEQVAAMVERFNAIFVRTLKALRDLRRTPGVVEQSAGQVNVAQQQVNVSGGKGQAPVAAPIPYGCKTCSCPALALLNAPGASGPCQSAEAAYEEPLKSLPYSSTNWRLAPPLQCRPCQTTHDVQ